MDAQNDLFASGRLVRSRQRMRPRLSQILRDPYALIILVGCTGLFLSGIRDASEWFFPYRWWFIGLIASGLLGVLAGATRIPYRAEHRCLVAFMAVATLSCLVSPMPEYSFARLATFVVMFFAVFVGAWLWLQNPRNLQFLVGLLTALIVAGALASLVYLIGELTSLTPSGRITGAFDKATGTGSFAAGSMPLVLWRVRYQRGAMRVVYAAILGILVYLLVFSGARAAIVAGLGALMVWTWKHRRTSRPWLAGTVCCLLVLFTADALTLDIVPSYIVRKESLPTFTGRIPLWKVGLQLFWESPLIGHGYGMTRYVQLYNAHDGFEGKIVPGSFSLMDLLPGGKTPRLGRSTLHSDHVERLLEMGLAGYVPFCLFWLLICRRIGLHLVQPPDRERSLALALGLNVAYVFLDSFMHGALFAINSPGVTVLWLAIVAFMAASDRVLVTKTFPRCASST